MTGYYLAPGLPEPAPRADGLDRSYWAALGEERILIQRCNACARWQWGPEWICHHCLSFDVGWAEVPREGRIFSWTRIWHPSHAALTHQGPYLVVLVQLPSANNVRVIGNLLGDPHQPVRIGARVRAVFEHHHDAAVAFTLLQWIGDE